MEEAVRAVRRPLRAAAGRPADAGRAALNPLPPIDWQRPWLAPLREPGQALAAEVAAGSTVAQVLDRAAAGITLHAGALRFVPQAALPAGTAFETFVHASASVPTREHLHDFFSGLVWLRQPALKRRLNEWQAAEIAHHGVGPRRGTMRDALTRFDESGALLQAPDALWQALRERDWRTLFVQRRAEWQEARLLIVGHALLEQLTVAPRKPLTAFVWAAGGDPAAAPASAWAGAPFLPLPVLGVPGWWPANEDPRFYDDAAVFRPPKALSDAGMAGVAGLKPRGKP